MNDLWNKVFLDNNNWINYSNEHFISFLVFSIIGGVFIYLGAKVWNTNQKQKYWLYLCIFLWIVQYAKVLIKWQLGTFDYQRDLPLELCNMLPIFMTFAVFFNSKKWWAILFFWIIAGTFQANFTPTLEDSLPHYEYFRYWIIHMGLPIAALYGVFAMGYRLNIKDGIRSFIWMNVVAWSMFVFNHFSGANYMFMQGKPNGKTIFDLMADWPYYLVQLQFVLAGFIILILIPFWITKYISKKASRV